MSLELAAGRPADGTTRAIGEAEGGPDVHGKRNRFQRRLLQRARRASVTGAGCSPSCCILWRVPTELAQPAVARLKKGKRNAPSSTRLPCSCGNPGRTLLTQRRQRAWRRERLRLFPRDQRQRACHPPRHPHQLPPCHPHHQSGGGRRLPAAARCNHRREAEPALHRRHSHPGAARSERTQ